MKKRKKKNYSSIRGSGQASPQFMNYLKRFARNIFMNKFVLAIGSGLIVGSVFGLVFLQLIHGDREEQALNDAQSPPTQQSSASSTQDTTEITIEDPDLYAVQIGVFRERENAEINKQQLQRRHIESVIWERDNEYFLLHSILSSESSAKKINEQLLDDDDVETFIKKWDIYVGNKQITDEELQWINRFMSLWTESLKQIEAGEAIPSSSWETLLTEEVDSSFISEFQVKVVDRLASLQKPEEAHIYLVYMLGLFEQKIIN